MILPDGSFMSFEQVVTAEIVEINSTHCKRMTSSEPLGDDYWLCYECGTVYKSGGQDVN